MNIPTKIKEAGKWVLVLVILKVLISIIELLLMCILYPETYLSFFNVLWELKCLFIRCLPFLIITLLTVKWIHKKYYYFVFPLILFLVSNFLFLFHLQIEENSVFFLAEYCSFAMDFYSYNANIISDILTYVHPLFGMFDGGICLPENTIYFYVLYAINPFVYYLGLTCLCNYIVKRKFKS